MSEPATAEAAAQGLPRQSGLVRFMNGVSRACLLLAGVALTLITIICCVNVFCRYVLFWALSWAEEAMIYLMISSVFFGVITVTWERIDSFLNMLGRGPRVLAEWLAVVITASVLFPIGWISWGVVKKLHGFDQRSDALDLPVWIPQATVPFALLAIPVVMVLVLLCRGADEHKS